MIHGPIATNVLNIYSCGLCAQTLDWNVDRRKLSYGVGVLATIFTIYLILNGDFASNLDGWLAGLVTWVAPWGAIMLVYYYWVAKQEIDVDALFEPPRLAAGPGHRLGGDHPVPARHRGHLDVRVRHPELPAGSGREGLGRDRPVLARWRPGRRRPVVRRAVAPTGALTDAHRRGLTADRWRTGTRLRTTSRRRPTRFGWPDGRQRGVVPRL